MHEGNWTASSRNGLSPRLVRTLNQDWAFNYLPDEAVKEDLLAPGWDDSKWPAIALPHTWSTYETTREPHPFIQNPSERDNGYWWNGWGYYRKTFALDGELAKDKKVFVEFDGVMKYCRVYLNGHFLGEHKGGYSGFYFDLTEWLRLDATNVLAVAVSNRRDDPFRIPPMTAGNFNVYGGIYRDVRLVVKDRLHIPFQGAYQHEGGTFVTTPQVTQDSGSVRVRTWVRNEYSGKRAMTLATSVIDPSGAKLLCRQAQAEIAPGEIHAFDQNGFQVERPRLWSPETPVLYSVESEVLLEGKVVDRYSSPLGFRWFEWNLKENRAYLNGKRLQLHGTNRHQEYPWLGDAIPKWITVRDLYDIRFGQGHNFMRTAHYPQDELVYDLADRYGILTCEEVPNIKKIEFARDTQKQQVLEMVRRDRNHPAIVMWSMGNETSHPADSTWAHDEDPTRLLHLRHSDADLAGPFIVNTHDNLEMENLLRCTVRGWTHRDVADYEPTNGQHAGTEEWQHAQAQMNAPDQKGRIDMVNGNMWIYADHGCDREYVNSPLKHINPKGWVDLYRIPKYMYFLWAANYTEQPLVFIHPHYWQRQYLGQKQDIIVDSNCESVELKVNGRRVGVLQPSPTNFWNVTFKDVLVESGTLSAEGLKAGKRLVSNVRMAGKPVRLQLSAAHRALRATRDSVAVVTVEAVDAEGTSVQGFSEPIEWQITGPGRLLMPEHYKSDIHRRHAAAGSYYIVTPTCAVIRSTGKPGRLTVSALSPGLAEGALTLEATSPPSAKSFVHEFALQDEGRVAVAPAPHSQEGNTAQGPMRLTVQDISLSAGRDSSFYRQELMGYFQRNDPGIIQREPAFSLLLGVLQDHLRANGGLLVADDFNFVAQQFNDFCALDNALRKSKLPERFQTGLRDHFARQLLRDGRQVNAKRESAWISALPEQSVHVSVEQPVLLGALFDRLYPEAAALPEASRQAALARFRTVNQAVIPYSEGYGSLEQPLPKDTAVLKPPLEWLQREPAAN